MTHKTLFKKIFAACCTLVAAGGIGRAQLAANLADIGTATPVPGTYDQSQLFFSPTPGNPTGLNYYWDNAQPPGQTFTTGNDDPNGYILNSVTLKTQGGGGSSGTVVNGSSSYTNSQAYNLIIYTVDGNNIAYPVAFYQSQPFEFINQSNWLRMTGLSLGLQPNTKYAYTFGRTVSGYENLSNTNGNYYLGGQACVISPGGGAINYGSSAISDGTFDIGLSLAGGQLPNVGTPVVVPTEVFALSPVVVSDTASGTSLQWQTNTDTSGGLTGTWVNIPGATSATITNVPGDSGSQYVIDYQLVASNSFGSTTSAPVALVVDAASGPLLTVDITPNPAITFVGTPITFSATFIGTTPFYYQWQTDAGHPGTFVNIPGATAATFTLASPATGDTGNYQLRISNVVSVAYSSSAALSVYQVLYGEYFDTTNATLVDINAFGWRNDVKNANGRVFIISGTNHALFSYCNAGTVTEPVDIEAFYVTTATENGSITNLGFPQQPFPSINLQSVQNMTFNVGMRSGFNPATVNSYFAVQMNFGQWYVSTTPLTFSATAPNTAANYLNYNLPFSPAAAGWNLLTLTGTGGMVPGTLTNVPPSIGASASSDLSGYITGAGVVAVHSGNGTHDYDNFIITGFLPFTALPVINSPPFTTTNYTGSTVSFSVSAVSNGVPTGLTYQWQTNASAGSSTWANISDGGQFSGSASSTLVISNITSAANHRDYRVKVTDGAGSTTSAPPATLTVIDSAPILVTDTAIVPNAVHEGNHNTIRMSASFNGNQPISYQWQVATDTNGTGVVNVPGATNSTFTLPNPTTGNMGYYSLKASNSQTVSPTNSTWTLLTVNPASTSLYTWSAVQSINGLTADQILNALPGTFFEAEVNGPSATVVVGSISYFFANDNSAATIPANGGPGASTTAFTGTTGNAALDAVLSCENETSGVFIKSITMHNLTPGLQYSAQLFAINDIGDPTRITAYADPDDATDISSGYAAGDNAYVVGTFTATNSDMTILQVLANGQGYFTAVVVRTLPPVLTAQMSGSNLQINWNVGTLLESTNVAGPYTPTAGSPTSPYVVTPTGPQKFYRVSYP